MRIIFCSDPLNPRNVDIDYESEYNTAKEIGLEVELISFEELVSMGNSTAAIKKIKESENEGIAIYRGWMLTPDKYTDLYNALKIKNIELINSPKSYKLCHYLPGSYDVIKDYTPKTIWFDKDQLTDSMDEVYETLVEIFGRGPIMIKDYVKSRKHEWEEACFVPDASDTDRVKRVVSKFIELQGEDLNEGIVFREFLKLEFLTLHSKSNMPLTKEFRVFFLDGQPLQAFNYWDEGNYGELKPDISLFTEVASKINSRFFTMDVAKVENGSWAIIELGDGQVSGLPNNANLLEFYRSLEEKLVKKINNQKVYI